MDLHLRDKVVVVTGGAAGIGAAIVRQLAEEGAVAVVLDRDAPRPELAAELASSGGQVGPVDSFRLDLGDEAACEDAVRRTIARRGGIDGLVNNAGANDGVGLGASREEFMRSLQGNLVHCHAMARLCLAQLRARRGAIVNISSKTALTGQGGTSAYVAAKAALLGLTREWAAELASDGVRVNAVLPAEVWTPMYERWLGTRPDLQAARREIERRIPLGRRMTGDREIADLVVFLLSDRSSHTTGQWLHPDGGYVHLDRALGAR